MSELKFSIFHKGYINLGSTKLGDLKQNTFGITVKIGGVSFHSGKSYASYEGAERAIKRAKLKLENKVG